MMKNVHTQSASDTQCKNSSSTWASCFSLVVIVVLLVVGEVEEVVILPILLVELSHGRLSRGNDLILNVDEERGVIRATRELTVDILDQVAYCECR